MMFTIRRGSTRIVLLIGRYAIKFPYFRYSYFYGTLTVVLQGWLSNRREYLWNKELDFLCPVLYSLFLSFIIVMPRVKHIKSIENIKKFNYGYEHKPCSYGYLDDKLVVVDYG